MDVTPASEKTAFLLLTALPAWLALARERRQEIADSTLGAALRRRPGITMRFYDAEAFTARCSDIAVFTIADLDAFYLLVEDLRDSQLFTVPYFRLDELILAVEDGHRAAA